MFSKPCPPYLAHPGLMAAAVVGTATRTPQAIYLHDVFLPEPAQLVSFSIQHGSVAAGHLDLGIFDTSGNLLAHTGITSAATFASAEQTIALPSPLNLSAGRYLYGFWIDSGTDTYYAIAGISPAFGGLQNMVNNSATGLQSASALAGLKPGTVFVPFMGHLAGTGF